MARAWAAGALVAAMAAALAAWARPAPAESAPPPRAKAAATHRYVVAAMGDSLTDPRSHGGKYLKYLAAKCPKSRFDSYGVGGNMVNQMRKRFARDVLGEPGGGKPAYTHVIVLGGINDICSDETAKRTNDKIEADLGAMYRMAHERGIEVVAMTLPPWAGFTRYYNSRRARSTFALNAWLEKQHGTAVDRLLDIYPLLSCGEPEHLCDRYGFPDHVHWNAKGHEVVGKALHQAIFSDCR